MAMPLVATGSLCKVLRSVSRVTWPEIVAIATQLRRAIKALHDVEFLHLDIKPSNVLWVPNTRELFLTDFGMAEHVSREKRRSVLLYNEYVTPQYRPPELWGAKGDDHIQGALTKAVDYWSFACVVLEVTVGRRVFPDHDPLADIEAYCLRVKGAPENRKALHAFGTSAHRLLKGMASHVFRAMDPEPTKRSISAWGCYESLVLQ